MTETQKEILDLMDKEQWNAVMALADAIIGRISERVLNTSVQDGARAIVLAKAKLDGARDLIDGMRRAQAQLRQEKK